MPSARRVATTLKTERPCASAAPVLGTPKNGRAAVRRAPGTPQPQRWLGSLGRPQAAQAGRKACLLSPRGGARLRFLRSMPSLRAAQAAARPAPLAMWRATALCAARIRSGRSISSRIGERGSTSARPQGRGGPSPPCRSSAAAAGSAVVDPLGDDDNNPQWGVGCVLLRAAAHCCPVGKPWL